MAAPNPRSIREIIDGTPSAYQYARLIATIESQERRIAVLSTWSSILGFIAGVNISLVIFHVMGLW